MLISSRGRFVQATLSNKEALRKLMFSLFLAMFDQDETYFRKIFSTWVTAGVTGLRQMMNSHPLSIRRQKSSQAELTEGIVGLPVAGSFRTLTKLALHVEQPLGNVVFVDRWKLGEASRHHLANSVYIQIILHSIFLHHANNVAQYNVID